MTELTLPDNLEGVTDSWLTEALRSNGVIHNAKVTISRTEDIGTGTGFMGTLARLYLEYDTPEEGAPETLVVKLPATSPENLMVALTLNFYEREVNFYRYAASISKFRTPITYHIDMDDSGQNFVLLLEDLGEAVVDQVEGGSGETSYKALMELARFHAQFAPMVQNDELDWALNSMDTDYVALNDALYRQSVEPALKNFESHFSPTTRKLAIDLADKITPLMNAQVKEAYTLIHGDFRLDNLFMGRLPPREGFPETGLAVVDWQICCKAEGPFDLAYHLCNIDISIRREIEERVLKDYYEILVSNGVKNYPRDTFMIQYRRFILFSLLYSISIAGTLDLANERGVDLARTYLDRTLAAIEDHRSYEVVPG